MSVTSPFNAPVGDRRNGAPAATPTAPPPSGMVGDRLPRPPRRRRPGFAALAVLLVVGAAAAAGLLAMRLDERTPVLVAARDLNVGDKIAHSDLSQVRVSAGDLSLIPSTEANTVVGQYVQQWIPAGRALDQKMLGDSGLLKEGHVAIGVPLKPGTAPAGGLRSGDRVRVVKAKDGVGTQLTDAVVSTVRESKSGGGGLGGGSGGGDSLVTIIVRDAKSPNGREDVATQVGAAAAAGQIVLELVSRGTTPEDTSETTATGDG